MQTESADAQKPNLPLMTFNDHRLIVIEFEDRPWFIAKQVGAKLGYADEGKSLITKLGNEWNDEFIDGVDCVKLTNGRLAAFKAAIKNQDRNTVLVDARAAHLLLLSESGAQLAAMKREGPEGVAFRKLLRFTILPEWQRSRQKPAPLSLPAPVSPAGSEPCIPLLPPELQPLHGLMERFVARGLLEAPVYEALRWQLEQAAPAPLTGPEGTLERVSLLAQLQTLLARAADLPMPCLRAIHRAVSAICEARSAS